jgi:hypothetical protein
MLTFAAAVVGVAATVGCGDASVGEMPSPILTAPPRATMTATARPWNVGTSTALPISAHGTTVVNEETGLASQLPSVPTAMVAAQERSSVVEQRTPNAPVGGSNPSVPANVEQWRGLVESIFPAFAVETMLRVVRCESSGNPAAHNENPASGDDSVGLAQVNLHASLLPGRIALLQSLGYEAYDRDSAVAILMDPEANLRAAYRISAGGTSWGAWTCR